MSLSNKDIRKALAERFVCSTLNAEGDPEAGGSFAHDAKDEAPELPRGIGEHNVQILFLTPKGEIFHALSGYVPPKDLSAEISFALKTFDALRAPGMDRPALVERLHRVAAAGARRRPDRGPLAFLGFDRVVQDHLFVADHPLLPAEKFRPSLMVGSGSSFFGASSGSPPKRLLGEG